MTPEAQRIAIAEACGYRPWTRRSWYSNSMEFEWSKCHPENQILNGWTLCEDKKSFCNPRVLPNYLHDLNACHEFEMAEIRDDPDFDNRYNRELARVTHGMNIVTVGGKPSFYVSLLRRATAAERCEAFLKTKGLWREI